MSSESDPRREDLLRRALTGELDPGAAELREALAADPSLADELEESQRVARTLDAAGAFERGVLRAAEREERAPGEERIAATVRGETRGWRRRSFRGGHWLALVSAAAVLFAVFLLTRRGDDAGGLRGGESLGGTVRLEAPPATDADFGLFRWQFELPAGGWYEVRVYDGTDSGRGVELARSPRLEASTWVPGAEVQAAWPREIRWEVHAFDVTGRTLATSSASAERSPDS